MGAAGAEVIDPVEITTRGDIGRHSHQVLLYEFKADLNGYLAALGGTMEARTLEQLIAYNEANQDREMPWFGQERFEAAQEKGPLTEPEYLEALATSRRLARTEGIDATMDRHRLDAIVAPTGGPAWTTDLVNGRVNRHVLVFKVRWRTGTAGGPGRAGDYAFRLALGAMPNVQGDRLFSECRSDRSTQPRHHHAGDSPSRHRRRSFLDYLSPPRRLSAPPGGR